MLTNAVEGDNCLPQISRSNIVTCDQEVWVKDRIRTAIEMSLDIIKRRRVHADEAILNSGIEGIINGTAVEIIRTLGLETNYINLTNPYLTSSVCGKPI